MAVAILQSSKLHFLKFVYEVLYKYFQPGCIVLNYCDTDSLAISFTRTCRTDNASVEQNLRNTFDNCLKPELKTDFYRIWEDWFVTTNEISDQKRPGKLKSMLE